MSKQLEFKNLVLKNTIIDLIPIENEVGALVGVNMKFNKLSQEEIYQTSEGMVVQKYPEFLAKEGLKLDLKSFLELNSALANTISTYLFELRKPLNQGELNLVIKSSLDTDKYLKVTVSKHFFREKTKGRFKINLSVMIDDADFGSYEVIMFQFTKKDVQLLFSMFKTIVSSYHRSRTTFINGTRVDYETGEFIEDVTVPIVKIDNSIVIDSIWLHGQEILNLMYIVDKLMYKMHIEQELDILNTYYRQIQFTNENGIIYLTLKKMNREHNEDPIKSSTGIDCKLKIPISSILLGLLHSFLSVEVLRHADIDFEYDSKTEILGSQDPFLSIKGMKYHISLRESFLGLAVHTREKDQKQVISFVGRVKEGAYIHSTEEGEVMNSVFEKKGEILNVLTEFKVDLKEQWPKLLKALSLAYTGEYKTEEKDFNLSKFYVINIGAEGKFKYVFSILSNKDNKASAVLNIDKIQIKNKEEKFIASYRQPLFDRYVFQLIVVLMAASEFMPDLEFIEKVDKKNLIKYRYKSMKQVIKLSKKEEVEYGLKKIQGLTYWGIFSDNNRMFTELSDQDQYLLNQSAYFRILRGNWQPFVGELIAIGPDRFLTDTFGEVNLEEKTYDSGLQWATKIFYGTAK